ncbi:MAG: type II toxin-antitoxin system RelB/DinJ family antitoxin [Parasphingopyxis sp.]|uniref:type II toxin-antitoxin system RelB/DinJ family antitoxin n=1 Tax=Parasphingopyxis sp. TaxID=1920299 RepID=UPI003F9EC1F5
MAVEESVRARIDGDTKQAATAALAAMGLSMSDAIRLMLRRVAEEKRLPFDVAVPNSESRNAMAELEGGGGKKLGSAEELFDELGI